MTDRSHIPPAAFAAAIRRLDAETFAEFVGDLFRTTADEVTVDPPVVTVETAAGRRKLLVTTDGSRTDGTTTDGSRTDGTTTTVDAVVIADEDATVDAIGTADEDAADVEVVGPTELRQRVLYAIPPATADDLCERFLDRPARSAAYASAERVVNGDQTATESGDADGGAVMATDTADAPLERVRLHRLTRRLGTWRTIALVLVVLAVAGSGGAFVAASMFDDGGDVPARNGGDGVPSRQSTAVGGDGRGETTVAPATSADPAAAPTATADATATVTTTADAAATVTTTASERTDAGRVGPTTSDARFVNVHPTCNRSFLLVVQIQVNALGYNDDTTNEGLRTVWGFFSPSTRRTIPYWEFVDLVSAPPYDALLSYDSAAYAPERVDDDSARVRVATRRNDTVTGRFAFSLTRQHGVYDGCWTTDRIEVVGNETSA
ncbi:MAG: hypothetical protein ABEI96_04045 [Haloarculaceae archaeon]